MGASGASSHAASAPDSSQSSSRLARSGNITASGFSSRRFRSRRRPTASLEVASTSSW